MSLLFSGRTTRKKLPAPLVVTNLVFQLLYAVDVAAAGIAVIEQDPDVLFCGKLNGPPAARPGGGGAVPPVPDVPPVLPPPLLPQPTARTSPTEKQR